MARQSTIALILIYLLTFFVIIDIFPLQFWLALPTGIIFIIIYRVILPYFRTRTVEYRRKVEAEELEEERKEWQSKSWILVGVGLGVVAIYFLLPLVFNISAWIINTLCYIVPLFTLSLFLTRDGDAFNFNLFFVGLLIYLLFPSIFGQSLSMMSFDSMPPLFNLEVATPSIEIPAMDDIGSAAGDLTSAGNLRDFGYALKTLIDTVRVFAFIVLPIVLAGLIVWAAFSTPDKVPGMLISLVLAIAIIAVFAVMFPGKILSFQGLDTTGPGGVINKMTNQIFNILPMIIGLVAVGIGYMARYEKFHVLMVDREDRASEKFDIKLNSTNWGVLVVLIVVALWAFTRFLMSTDMLGYGNPMLLGLYIGIILIGVFIIMLGKSPLNNGTISSNVTGIAFGIGGLFLAQQAITAAAYNASMLAYSLDVTSGGLWGLTAIAVLDTMIFTAVTESILLHIAIPGATMRLLYHRIRTEEQRAYDQVILREARKLQVDINRKRTLITILEKKEGLSKEVLEVSRFIPEVKADVTALKRRRKLTSKIAYLNAEIQDLEEEIVLYKEYLGTHAKIGWGKMIFSEWKYTIYFLLVSVILPNIVFAIMHYWRSGGFDASGNLLPPPDFFLWVIDGPFLVFVVSGMVLTLIGFKYGWYSCILTHGLWNGMLIMISAVTIGGLS
jgi:hypothetical protein